MVGSWPGTMRRVREQSVSTRWWLIPARSFWGAPCWLDIGSPFGSGERVAWESWGLVAHLSNVTGPRSPSWLMPTGVCRSPCLVRRLEVRICRVATSIFWWSSSPVARCSISCICGRHWGVETLAIHQTRYLYMVVGAAVCRFRGVELAPGAIVDDDVALL